MSGQVSAKNRVVIIGASNVTRGLRGLIRQSLAQLGGPIEFLIAAGHGRSLGVSTQVIIRRLPSIRECELWSELSNRPKLPTFALVTDLGNDLPYEIPVSRILMWFEDLLKSLSEHQANIVFATPPIDSIQRLQRWQFNALRSVLFPGSKLNFDDAVQFAGELAEKSQEISKFFLANIVKPSSHWYGFDPIHIKRRFLPEAWQVFTRQWTNSDRVLPSAEYRKTRISTWRFQPYRRWLMNREQQRSQPCWHSHAVGSISMF